MYHKLTVYVKSRYQTNLFPSCCFGDRYHKYHGNSINTLQISFIFLHTVHNDNACFRDARHGFNIYSILCPLGGATCSVEQSCKKVMFLQALTLSNLDHWPRGPVDLRSYWPEGQ